MSDPFPNLEAHMCYEHHWSVDLVDEMGPYQMLELHTEEHDSGYPGHSHEDTA